MNLRKTFFILPNLFTLANVFCGFFALTLCAGDATVDELYQAALAICFGFIFDLFDGRVARLTRTQSALGLQLDSLADVITFGAAPAMLVYKWGLTSFGLWGVIIAFMFVAAGALRLARFNVLSQRKEAEAAQAKTRTPRDEAVDDPGDFFVGLPIPGAAAVIVALVVVNYWVGGRYVFYSQGAIATLVLVLSYLMISRVRFRTFKKIRLTYKTLGVLLALTTACLLIIAKLRASFIFIFVISMYLALGLTEEIYRFAADRRRTRRERKIATGEVLVAADHDHLDDDEEVLRELGGK